MLGLEKQNLRGKTLFQALPCLLSTHMRVMLALLQNAFTSREPRMAETCTEGFWGRFMRAVTLYPSPKGRLGMGHVELDPWGAMQGHPKPQPFPHHYTPWH